MLMGERAKYLGLIFAIAFSTLSAREPAILASAAPLGIVSMTTFPLSLIALGQIRRKQFDDTLTLRPKRKNN